MKPKGNIAHKTSLLCEVSFQTFAVRGNSASAVYRNKAA